MPDYDKHPIEGYIYDEPTGRPRADARYRNPAGDSRILKSLIGLVLLAGVAVLGSAIASRFPPRFIAPPTLAEGALGENPVECRPNQLTDRWTFRLSIDGMLAHSPEVQHAAGLRMVVEAYSTKQLELITTERIVVDVREVDWSASELPLEVALPKGPGVDNFIGTCSVELTPIGDAKDLPPFAPLAGDIQP